MSRFEKIGVWILVAAVVLLPLYELSDYTEVCPNDGNVILTALAGLLLGMALVSGVFFRKELMVAIRYLMDCARLSCLPVFEAQTQFILLEVSPPGIHLPLTCCDLRI
jgi:hypothetical protein